MMVLSTNCEYYGAYQALAGMADELNQPSDAASYRRDGAALRAAINQHLWRPEAGIYGYFIHGNDSLAGRLDTSQEGGGLAFAILLGVADPQQTQQVLTNTHWQPHGIVNVWPSFPRFSDEQPGRHNVMVWPMVHSMYGHAAAVGGRVDLFDRAVTDLANLAAGSGNSFFELYNSITGAVDGGWQVGRHWDSRPNQTWSATGYLRMIYYGLFGLTFTPDGLTFAPTLPAGWGPVSLYGLPYRDMTIDIELSGAGNRIRSGTVNGNAGRVIPANATGTRTVRINLGD
jgi:glycogen debranching enzyme